MTTIQIMGKDKNTLKIYYKGISYLMFNATEEIMEIQDSKDKNITIIGRANVNEWNGTISPQVFIDGLEIKDILSDF